MNNHKQDSVIRAQRLMSFQTLCKNNSAKVAEKNAELLLLKKQSEEKDAEKLLQEIEESKYKNQKILAKEVVNKLYNDNVFSILIYGLTQSGKTQLIIEIVNLYIKKAKFNPDNIIITTGLSDTNWVKQTKKRLRKSIKKKNIFHRPKMEKILNSKLKKNIPLLIILDEMHFGTGKDTVLSRIFKQHNLEKPEDFEKRNIKLVTISATPDGCIHDINSWGSKASTMKLEPGKEYTGLQELKDKDILEDIPNNINEKIPYLLNKIIDIGNQRNKKTINLLRIGKGKYGVETKKIIKKTTKDIEKKTGEKFKLINLYNKKNKNKNKDINKIIKRKAPKEHTIILIKEKLRCAKTIDYKNHIGIVVERTTQKFNDTAIIQGLLGRITGYTYIPEDMKIYVPIDTIDRYLELWNNNFKNFKEIRWNSQTTKFQKRIKETKSTHTFLNNGINSNSMNNLIKFENTEMLEGNSLEEVKEKYKDLFDKKIQPHKHLKKNGFLLGHTKGYYQNDITRFESDKHISCNDIRNKIDYRFQYDETKPYKYVVGYEDMNDNSTAKHFIIFDKNRKP